MASYLGGQAIVSSIQSKIRETHVGELIKSISQRVENGTIPMRTLLSALAEHNVQLDSKECELIDRRFVTSNGEIEYHKLMKTLDIGLPSDHIDPDLFLDPLPQPYRMISKLLEVVLSLYFDM
jgi:hypothetical protein